MQELSLRSSVSTKIQCSLDTFTRHSWLQDTKYPPLALNPFSVLLCIYRMYKEERTVLVASKSLLWDRVVLDPVLEPQELDAAEERDGAERDREQEHGPEALRTQALATHSMRPLVCHRCY